MQEGNALAQRTILRYTCPMAAKTHNSPSGPPTPQRVAALCRDNNTPVAPPTAEALCTYLELLVKWNRRCNLVGPYDWPKMLLELVLDSWHLAGFIQGLNLPDAPVCLDLGAGAGLPGVPLRLLWNKGAYRLAELREKRTIFLETVLARLKPPDTRVLRMDAAQALAAHAPVDMVLSRAFMPWPNLLELVEPHLAPGGMVLGMSNDPLPETLPRPWRSVAAASYPAAGKTRYLWAVSAPPK